MENIKIAIVYDAVYPYIKGGGEIRNYEIAKRLAKKGFQVHLYGMKFWKGKDVILKENIYYHGICKPINLYTSTGRRSIWEAFYFGINCLKIINEDFDVIDCCTFPYFSIFSCKIICLLKRKKLYSTCYEIWGKNYWKEYLGYIGYFAYLIEKISISMPDIFISISQHTTQKLKKDFNIKKKIYTIPPGIDLLNIQNIKPSSQKSDVIFAGRLLSNKNIDYLIKSISLIKATKPNIICIIIGNGPEKDKLKQLTKKLNLQKNIFFYNFFEKRNELYAFLKSSKVFLLPSSREGFGLIAIEANACGLPILTIDAPNNGAKDLIINENGLVSKFTIEEITSNLNKLLLKNNNYELRKNCINSIKDYDWDSLINKLNFVYTK